MKSKTNRAALFVLGALFLTGCFMVGMPGPATNFLSGGDERIAIAIREAAADWARHGLEIARYVTVDDGRGGVPVRFAPESEINQYRPKNGPPVLYAVAAWEMGDWLHILVDDRLASDPAATLQALKHEMIHVLVPNAPHLSGAPGILTGIRSSNTITAADMDLLSRFTEVGPSEVPFASESSA